MPEKKSWINGHFLDQNHGLTPLEKCQFLDFLKFSFNSLEKRFFFLEYHKRHFPNLYSLRKTKLEKWPFLNQNHGLTPLKKCQFFDFLNFLFLEKRFFVLENHKRHFPGPHFLQKKLGKWPFLDQNHGVTDLEKCQFLDFLNFLFL